MKIPLKLAIVASSATACAVISGILLKLLSLGTNDFSGPIHILGLPVAFLQNSKQGFGVELLYGYYVVSLAPAVLLLSWYAARVLVTRISPSNPRPIL